MSRTVTYRSFAIVAVVLLGLTGACASGSRSTSTWTPDAPPLEVTSLEDGFELVWDPDRGVPDEPEIQVAVQSPLDEDWHNDTDWQRVDLGDATDHRVVYDDVELNKRYRFRIRGTNGDWASSVYRIHVATTLPVVRLDTNDPEPGFDNDKDYRDGRFSLDPADTDAEPVEVGMRIRARGNSTWESVQDKMSYQVDFGHQVSLLGMPESDKWVLLANFLDPSQMRNWTAMQIAQATDLAWTPRSAWVEVYLNGDYQGLYQVFEKVDTGPGKVDIDDLTPAITEGEALTGGYLLQIAWGARPDKYGWITPHQVKIHVQRPKRKHSNDAQFEYIRDFVDTFEAALFSDEFTDPETGYRRYLDVDSFIDMWIVQETTVNTDAYADSLYFYKPRGDDKLYFGPAWDFDTSLGTRLSLFTETTKPWYTTQRSHRAGTGDEFVGERRWVIRIFEDPWFREQVAERWNRALPEIEKIPAELLEVARRLEPAKANDLLRWKDSVDTVVGEHRFGDREPMDDPQFIADWLSVRIAFITDAVQTSIRDYPPE